MTSTRHDNFSQIFSQSFFPVGHCGKIEYFIAGRGMECDILSVVRKDYFVVTI